jgi:hypothetical protein
MRLRSMVQSGDITNNLKYQKESVNPATKMEIRSSKLQKEV